LAPSTPVEVEIPEEAAENPPTANPEAADLSAPVATDESSGSPPMEALPEPPPAAELVGAPEPEDPGVAEEIVSEPPAPEPEPEPIVPRGGIELEVGSSVVASLQPFLEAAAAGLKGVCIVRESPERIAAQVGARPVDIYWLSNLGRGRTVKPNDLHAITEFLVRQLEEEKVTIFFLEGIEYLVRIHGVDATVDRLLEFGRRAEQQEARVWVHVTPDLLKPADLERIQHSLGPRDSSAPA
jgi:hypothetical protein